MASPPQRSLDELPLDAVTNIMVLVGKESAINVMKCKKISRTFRAASNSNEVYRNMETDSLTSGRYWGYLGQSIAMDRCRAAENPNVKFIDGLNRYFFLNDDTGIQMLEEASAAGKKEATFLLGMLMMAEGEPRKAQAMQMLNAAFPSPRDRVIIREINRKIERMLDRNGRRSIEFNGCPLTCTIHHYSRDFALFVGAPWVYNCDVCLWEACFMKFGRIFEQQYGDWFFLNYVF